MTTGVLASVTFPRRVVSPVGLLRPEDEAKTVVPAVGVRAGVPPADRGTEPVTDPGGTLGARVTSSGFKRTHGNVYWTSPKRRRRVPLRALTEA